METIADSASSTFLFQRPHSLGIPIEWKHYGRILIKNTIPGPHSLGIPIEWKPDLPERQMGEPLSPHSLGIPIEWKLNNLK